MFIVLGGKVTARDHFGNKTTAKRGAILGGMGLLYGQRQIAGAKAADRVTCLALGKSSLERLIGNVEDALRRASIQALLDHVEFYQKLTTDQRNVVLGTFEDGIFEKGDLVVSKGAR